MVLDPTTWPGSRCDPISIHGHKCYKCNFCHDLVAFQTKRELRRHEQSAPHFLEKPYWCRICPLQFKFPSQLGRHPHRWPRGIYLRDADSLPKTYECRICVLPRPLIDLPGVMEHMRQQHPSHFPADWDKISEPPHVPNGGAPASFQTIACLMSQPIPNNDSMTASQYDSSSAGPSRSQSIPENDLVEAHQSSQSTPLNFTNPPTLSTSSFAPASESVPIPDPEQEGDSREGYDMEVFPECFAKGSRWTYGVTRWGPGGPQFE